MQEALRTQTWNAAYAGFVEDRLGSLEVGKLADVTVLGDDPMTFPAAEFHHLPIAVTISGGKVVFRGEPTMAMPPMRGGPARRRARAAVTAWIEDYQLV